MIFRNVQLTRKLTAKIEYSDRHSLVKLLDWLFSIAGLEVLKLLMMPKKSFQIEMFKQPFVRCLEFWTALFSFEVLVATNKNCQGEWHFSWWWSSVMTEAESGINNTKRERAEKTVLKNEMVKITIFFCIISWTKKMSTTKESLFSEFLAVSSFEEMIKKCMFGDWQLLIFLGQWKNVPWNLPEVDKKLIFRLQN